MLKPLIGITFHSAQDPHRASLDRFCTGAIAEVEKAGGLPVLIPHGIAEQAVHDLVARLDGLLLTGGGDIAAVHYGGRAHQGIAGIDEWRDRVELVLVRRAVASGLPLLGICRGCQVLNVALGGTLHAEVSEIPGGHRHTYYPDFPLDRLSHPVHVADSSRLGHLTAQSLLWVNSLHHQAIDRLAPGLRSVAVAPDGLIEAVEVDDHPFGLAVQWHPEALPDETATRALFSGFVAACRKTRPAA